MAEQVREGGAEEVAIPDPAVGAGESAAMDSEVQIGEVDTMLLKAKTATEVATTVPDVGSGTVPQLFAYKACPGLHWPVRVLYNANSA